MAARPAARRRNRSAARINHLRKQRFIQMEAVEEIFDEANGDLAVGDLERAVDKYRRCVEMDANFCDGWHALGMALMKIGRFAEAIEAERNL